MLGAARSGLLGAVSAGGAVPPVGVSYILNADWRNVPDQSIAAGTTLTAATGVGTGTLTVIGNPLVVAGGHAGITGKASWTSVGLRGEDLVIRGGTGRVTLIELYGPISSATDFNVPGHVPTMGIALPKTGPVHYGSTITALFNNVQISLSGINPGWNVYALVEAEIDGGGFHLVHSAVGSPWRLVAISNTDKTNYYACLSVYRGSGNYLRRFKITETLFPDLLLPGADYSILDTI